MTRTVRTMAGAAALALVAAGALAAQQPAQPRRQPAPAGQMDKMPGMPGPMMGGTPAAHVLQMKEHFKLTDEQVKKLEALNTAQAASLAPQRGAQLRVAADLADAMQGEGNLTAARAAMEKGAKLRIDAAIAHMQAMKDARAVLTTEQKGQLDAMHQMMMRRGGMGRGGMRGMMGPDMHGDMMEGMDHGAMHGPDRQAMPIMRRPGSGGQRAPQGPRPPEGEDR